MAGSNPTGKAILKASLELFRQDRQKIWDNDIRPGL